MQRLLNHIYLILIMVMMILNWSCSPKTLSVFFDGVPNPDDSLSVFSEQPGHKSVKADESAMPAREEIARYFFHSPYQQKECASCHNPNIMGQLNEPVPGLCYGCHDNFTSSYKVLHAPVEAGECLSCHKPHMADNRHLLHKTGQQLCFECHDPESTLQTDYHSEIGNDDCTDCHNPHGGNERFILN